MDYLAIPEGSLPPSSIILLAIYTASKSLNRYSKVYYFKVVNPCY